MCAKERGLDTERHIESERVSRRTALKRLGITAGMAMFSLLTADDLARAAIAQATSGDGMKQCKQVYDDCILMYDGPEGCNCAGGSLWPWCWESNFCIGPYNV